MSNSSIWPIDRILSGATTPGESGSRSDSNEQLLRIRQRSNKSYHSAEMKSVYSAAPAD